MAIRDLELHVNVTGNADVKLPELDRQMSVLVDSTYTATSSASGFNMAWNNTANVIGKADERMKTMTQTNLRATYTMFQMNQVVRDLPFGFIAISNNLPLLYDQFMMLTRTTAGLKGAMVALRAAIFSPSGIAVAISGLISIITVLAVKSQGAKKETEEFTLETIAASTAMEKYGKSVAGIRSELEKLTDAQVLSRLERMKTTVQEGVDEMARATTMPYFAQGWFLTMLLGDNADDALNKIMQAVGGIVQAEEVLDGRRSKIGILRNRIKDLEKARYNLPEDSPQSNFDAINERIRIEQDSLDKLLGKYKEVHEKIKEINNDAKSMQWSGVGVGDATRSILSTGVGDATRSKRTEQATTAVFGREYQNVMNNVNKMSSIGADVLRENYNQAWENVFGTANSLFEQYANRIIEFFASDIFAEISGTFVKWALTAVGFPELGAIVDVAGNSSNKSGGGGGDRPMYLVVNDEVIGKFVDKKLPDSIYRNQKLGLIG